MQIRRFLLAAVAVLGVSGGAFAQTSPQLAPAPEAPTGRSVRDHGVSTRYMAAAANPLATEAGREMLRAGGSAVDAAIAVQLVLNLVEPQSSGIGGGAFMVHWDEAERTLTTLDGRETAPAAATPDRFLGADGKPMQFYDAVVGGRSVGVPGTLRLLDAAHKRWGKLPWPQLFEPAIAPRRGRLSGLAAAQRPARAGEVPLRTTGGARAYFYDADGKPQRGRHDAARTRPSPDAARHRREGRGCLLRRADRRGHRRHRDGASDAIRAT